MDGHQAAMEDLRRILAAREPLYAKADAVVDTFGEPFEASFAKLTDAIADVERGVAKNKEVA